MTQRQKLSQFYFIVILLLATPWFVFDPYYAEECYVFHGGPVVSIRLNVSIHHPIVVHTDLVFFVHLMVDSVKIPCCWLMSPHWLTQPSVDWVWSSLMLTCKVWGFRSYLSYRRTVAVMERLRYMRTKLSETQKIRGATRINFSTQIWQ